MDSEKLKRRLIDVFDEAVAGNPHCGEPFMNGMTLGEVLKKGRDAGLVEIWMDEIETGAATEDEIVEHIKDTYGKKGPEGFM